MDRLQEILSLEDGALFSRAGREGEAHSSRCFWSPVILAPGCATAPPCRHCKWESFKRDRPAFGQRRTLDDILRSAELALKSGATHLLSASGWAGYEVPDSFCEAVAALKRNFRVPVYGLYGAIHRESLLRLREAGLDGYQCGLESPDPTVYRRFRPGGDSLEDRKETLREAKSVGLKTWSGFLLALGLSDEAALEGLRFFREQEMDWVAIQPFVPFPGTALEREDPTNPYRWARMMAAARLYLDPKVNLVATENSGGYQNFISLTGANAFFLFPGQRRPPSAVGETAAHRLSGSV